MGVRRSCGKWVLPALMAAVVGAVPSWGAVVGTGDVVPANPATWTSATVGYVGNTGIGGVTVDSGSVLQSQRGYLGYGQGATGTMVVDGVASAWIASGKIVVGESGVGTLLIADGGALSSSGGFEYIAYNAGASG